MEVDGGGGGDGDGRCPSLLEATRGKVCVQWCINALQEGTVVVGGPYPRSVGRNPGALPSAVLWPAHFHASFC